MIVFMMAFMIVFMMANNVIYEHSLFAINICRQYLPSFLHPKVILHNLPLASPFDPSFTYQGPNLFVVVVTGKLS